MTYTVKTSHFEGPFDLLLFFIERDELDIYDIPIADITEDFLAYIRQMESLNIDLASEFILVAATLMRIKAKMLLPRKELNEHGEEIDPRAELVQKLVEYRKFKDVVDDLRLLEEERSLRFKRGDAATELSQIATKALVDVELESLSLFKLMKAFEAAIKRFEEKGKEATIHSIYNYSYTIQDQEDYIRTTLNFTKEKTSFSSLFEVCENRIHAIVLFLALLEMLNLHQIQIHQGEGVNNFWVEAAIEDETF